VRLQSSYLFLINSTLNPREPHEFFRMDDISFRMDDICLLVNKFYLQDFKNHENLFLKIEPHQFEH
jgi:hypothetical protein